MLASTFINPINLPNLLTPFRYNLEIQYVVFSVIFVALLGYVIFTFLDGLGAIDKIFILLATFVVLLFLYLVIKERNRIDEYTLQEETVNMEEELARIDRDIKLKQFLKEEASKGIVYDKNDERVDTGKADLAKVNNYKSEINKLEIRKKELQDKKKNYDSTYLAEAADFVKSKTESEMNHLQKHNEALEKEIRYSTGISNEELDKEMTELRELEFKASVAKGEGNETQARNLETEINEKKKEIQKIENNMENLKITSKDRVEIDRKRRKLEENISRQREIGGLFDREDNYLLKQKEIFEADKELEEAKTSYNTINKEVTELNKKIKDLNNKKSQDGSDKKKQQDRKDLIAKYEKLVNDKQKILDDRNKDLTKARQNQKEVEKFKKFNIGNNAIKTAEGLINNYDNETEIGAMTMKSKQLAAFQKLSKLENEADFASEIAKSAADLGTATESGKAEEKKRALARTAASFSSNRNENNLYEQIKDMASAGDAASRLAAILKSDKTGAKLDDGALVTAANALKSNFNDEARSARNNPHYGESPEEAQKRGFATAFLNEVSGIKDINKIGRVYNAEKYSGRTPEEAKKQTTDFIFSPENQRIYSDLDKIVNSGGSIKPEFSETRKRLSDNLRANIAEYDKLDSRGLLPRQNPGDYDNLSDKEKRNVKRLLNQLKNQLQNNTQSTLTAEEKSLQQRVETSIIFANQ